MVFLGEHKLCKVHCHSCHVYVTWKRKGIGGLLKSSYMEGQATKGRRPFVIEKVRESSRTCQLFYKKLFSHFTVLLDLFFKTVKFGRIFVKKLYGYYKLYLKLKR